MEKKKDLYSDYNHENYAHYRNVATGEFEVQKVKSAKLGERHKPIMKKVKVSFDEVKELKLDKVGTVAPTLDTEDFTIISNYLVDFWGAVMGNCAVDAYLHLKRHAYGKKDYCYIDIDLIALKMRRSKNAVKGYLEILEEHGFIATFLRKDITDNNRDVSPLFKIRRYVPLITEEMYNALHPKLKKLHDDFISDYEGIALNSKMSKTEEIIGSIVNEGEVINNREMKEKIEQVVKEGQLEQYILNRIDDNQRQFDLDYHQYMSNLISKPSYDTWIKPTVLLKEDESTFVILASNEFCRDWIEQKYISSIREYISEKIYISDLFAQDESINISCELMKDFIEREFGRVV